MKTILKDSIGERLILKQKRIKTKKYNIIVDKQNTRTTKRPDKKACKNRKEKRLREAGKETQEGRAEKKGVIDRKKKTRLVKRKSKSSRSAVICKKENKRYAKWKKEERKASERSRMKARKKKRGSARPKARYMKRQRPQQSV